MSVKNLKNEAEKLLKGLTTREKYNLFEIVNQQLGKRQSAEKQAELNAVYKAIVNDPDTDAQTLYKMEKGHNSLLSDDVKRGDLTSNARKNKKKA